MGGVAHDEENGNLLTRMVNQTSSVTMPSCPALEAFLAVARHGSFRRAAAERHVTPSALSHVIRGLEDTLGVRLFNRTNRSIRLTEAGEHLLKRIRPALCDINEAIAQVNAFRGRPAGLLRLNVPRIAAEMIVKPVMGRFLAAYPEIRLDVVTNDGLVDIVAAGFDAGIRPGRLLAQDMIAVPVGARRRFAVVGAPGYFAGRERPVAPQDLHGHSCIGRSYPSGARYAWEFGREGEALEVDVTGPLVVDDSALMVAAALEGVGVAFVYESLVAEAIARGALVRVLEDWCPQLPHFFLYYPGRRQIPAPLRAFVDMVRATEA
jgi:DNA-binding transcriptional LysR family regulator